ncbi:hypothetical protein K7432_000109 [Basidiobolus ranarum]|uniref:Sphingomyelin synthase-like domain-containing protein n=1 Tax=Basidiobolus ranarum TaxID=34480 RepID=A0ABR2X559_9FUNG
MEYKKSLCPLKPELLRLGLSILYILVVLYYMLLIQLMSDQRWAASTIQDPLTDLGFSTVPILTKVWAPDFFVFSLLLTTLCSLIYLARTWLEAIVILRRFVWLTGTLYLLRSITIIVTTLPCPRDCQPIQTKSYGEFLWVALTMLAGQYQTCSDNIFSGHTMILVSCMTMWSIYGRKRWVIVCAYVYGISGILSIVATRMHYTVDIFLAILITKGLYTLYFSSVDEASQRMLPAIITLDNIKGSTEPEQKSFTMIENKINATLLDIIVWIDGLDLRLKNYSSVYTSVSPA